MKKWCCELFILGSANRIGLQDNNAIYNWREEKKQFLIAIKFNRLESSGRVAV